MMSIQNALTYDDEVYEFKTKQRETIGDFQAIGRLHGMNDIFNALSKVSKPAFELFNDFKETRDYHNNLCYIDISDLTRSQLNLRRKRIKELKDAHILKKAKTIDRRNPVIKGSYMLNPHFIKCVFDIEGTEAMWKLL